MRTGGTALLCARIASAAPPVRPASNNRRPAGAKRRRRPTGPRRPATGSRAKVRSTVAKRFWEGAHRDSFPMGGGALQSPSSQSQPQPLAGGERAGAAADLEEERGAAARAEGSLSRDRGADAHRER